MNNWVYLILKTGETYSRTTQQIADHCFRDVVVSISHRHIYVSHYTKDRKDAQRQEAMVKWIFSQPTQSSNSNKWSKIDDTCADLDIFTPSRTRQNCRNGGKTERTRYLVWKTADMYLMEGQVTANNSANKRWSSSLST